MIGRRLNSPESEEKASDIQTPEDGVDGYIVARAMSYALSTVKGRCARYLTTGRTFDDNRLEAMKEDFILELNMPDSWNYGETTRLTELMHNYVVDYCLYSILEKTVPEESGRYIAKANTWLGEIKSVLETRVSPVRRRLRLY